MPEPTRKLNVFLCHASQDKPIVRDLYQRLSLEGWIDPWLDEEKLLPGHDWDMEIEKAVEAADVVIVCLSNNSVNKEGYIQKELRKILDVSSEKPEGTIFTIPLRFDNCQPPSRLKHLQYADYFPKEEREVAYKKLIRSLFVRADVFAISRSVQSVVHENTQRHLFQNGDLSIDFSRGEVWKGQFVVYLTPTEYRLLLHFVNNIGKIMSSEDLLISMWGAEYRFDKQILFISIARLKQKLEDDPHLPKYIVTRSGKGYVMPLIKK